MRDAVFLDKVEVFLRIEFFHDDQRRTELRHRHAPAKRRSVIERRGRQVDGVFSDTGQAAADLYEHIVGVDGQAALQRRTNAFRATRGAG